MAVNIPAFLSILYKKFFFARYIYPRTNEDISDPDIPIVVAEDKPEWKLLICVPELNSNIANWYKGKFGLDEDFFRCITCYNDIEIKIKMIDLGYPIQAKDAKKTRALIFDSAATTMKEMVPKAVKLEHNELLSDYHILLMSPATISCRIIDEVDWLARESCNY